MIHELLSEGRENAQTGKELARLLHVEVRTVTEQIERERKQGQPICATTTGEHPGYYLSNDFYEIERYCEALRRRADRIYKTRTALRLTAERIAGIEAEEQGSFKI